MKFYFILQSLQMVLGILTEISVIILGFTAFAAYRKWVGDTEEVRPSRWKRLKVAWKAFKQSGFPTR